MATTTVDADAEPFDFDTLSDLRDFIRDLLTSGVHGNVLRQGTPNFSDGRHRGLQEVVRLYTALENGLAAKERERAEEGEGDAGGKRRAAGRRPQRERLHAAEARQRELERENTDLKSQAQRSTQRIEELTQQNRELRQEAELHQAAAADARAQMQGWRRQAGRLQLELDDVRRTAADGYDDDRHCPYCDSTSVPDHDNVSSQSAGDFHQSETGSDAYTPAPAELTRAAEIELGRQENHISAVQEHVSELSRLLHAGDVVWMEKTSNNSMCSPQRPRDEGDDREGLHAGKRLFKILEGDSLLIRKGDKEAVVDAVFGHPIPDLWRGPSSVQIFNEAMRWTTIGETPLPDEQLTLMYGWP